MYSGSLQEHLCSELPSQLFGLHHIDTFQNIVCDNSPSVTVS